MVIAAKQPSMHLKAFLWFVFKERMRVAEKGIDALFFKSRREVFGVIGVVSHF